MNTKKTSLFMKISLVCILIILAGCKKERNLNDLAINVVKSIQTQHTEEYYSMFPNSGLVAQHGIFAYGLHAVSRSDLNFWLRPYSDYRKSVDSLEQVARPSTFRGIQQMFNEFHATLDWKKVHFDGIDTTQTLIDVLSDLKNKKRIKSITATMNIHISFEKKKYLLVCPEVFYIENNGWFLRNAPSAIKLMENK